MTHAREIAGRRFTFAPVTAAAAIEGECILAQVLGPAASAGISTALGILVEHAAVKLRRTITASDEGDRLDLANLEGLLDRLLEADTGGMLVGAILDAALETMPELASGIPAAAGPALASAIDWPRARRLFEIFVLGRVHVELDDGPRKVATFEALDALGRSHWLVKWTILYEAIRWHFEGSLDELRAATGAV